VPIVPGIMPITNSAGLLRFADSCGAEVPRWMRLRLQSLGDDVAAIKDFGAEVMARLCQRLIEGGAPALHFYTLNQAAPTLALCQRLGLGADAGRSRGVCYSTICI
jgi:methylenetetrahydrofolate reductase (NADPH)